MAGEARFEGQCPQPGAAPATTAVRTVTGRECSNIHTWVILVVTCFSCSVYKDTQSGAKPLLCLLVTKVGSSDVQLVRDCVRCTTGETGRVAPQQWTRSGSLSLSFSAAAGGRTGLPLPTSEEGGEGGG